MNYSQSFLVCHFLSVLTSLTELSLSEKTCSVNLASLHRLFIFSKSEIPSMYKMFHLFVMVILIAWYIYEKIVWPFIRVRIGFRYSIAYP